MKCLHRQFVRPMRLYTLVYITKTALRCFTCCIAGKHVCLCVYLATLVKYSSMCICRASPLPVQCVPVALVVPASSKRLLGKHCVCVLHVRILSQPYRKGVTVIESLRLHMHPLQCHSVCPVRTQGSTCVCIWLRHIGRVSWCDCTVLMFFCVAQDVFL